MATSLSIVTITAALIVAASQPKAPTPLIESNRITLFAGDYGAYLCKAFPPDFKIGEKASFIKPSKAELTEIQASLPNFLKLHSPHIFEKLGQYAFQIVGIQDKGEKRIYINAFPNSILVHDPSRKASPVVVDDGGDSFWRLCYSLKNKTYSGLTINGDA